MSVTSVSSRPPLVPGWPRGSELPRYGMEAPDYRPAGASRGSPRHSDRAGPVPLEVEVLEVVPDGVHEGLQLLLGIKVRYGVVEVWLGSREGVRSQLRRRRRRRRRRSGLDRSGHWPGDGVGEAGGGGWRWWVVYGGGLVRLLERRVDVAVAHDVTRATGGNLVDVHVQAWT